MMSEYRHIPGEMSPGYISQYLQTEQRRLTEWATYQIHTSVALNSEQTTLALLYPNSKVVLPEQVHSGDLTFVDRFTRSPAHNSDGLITDDEQVILAARGADCPIVAISDGRVRGLMHSGWRGTLADAPGELVYAMGKLRADPVMMRVYVSPGIRSCCYALPLDDPHERADRFRRAYGTSCVLHSDSWPMLDLQWAVQQSLLDAGIQQEHIVIDRRCTCCSSQFFPSHRREGALRQANLVVTLSDSSWKKEVDQLSVSEPFRQTLPKKLQRLVDSDKQRRV